MRTLSVAVCLLLILLSVSSCQREISWEQAGRLNSDSTYLSKLIYLDTTLPAGQDTLEIMLHEYDALNRLIKVSNYILGGGVDSSLFFFRYTGNDSLPFSMKVSGMVYDSSINYYRYNNGLVVYDSLVNFDGLNNIVSTERVITVLPAGNGRFLYKEVYPPISFPGFPVIPGRVDSILFSRSVINRNIVAGIDSIWSNGTFSDRKVMQYNYDQRKNPFKSGNFWYNGFHSQASFGLGWGLGNNPLFADEKWDVVGHFITSLDYDYNTDGYPIVARVQVSGPGALVDYNKLLFLYVKR